MVATATHYLKVKVEVKYTVTECEDTEKPYKESRNQWTEVVHTKVPDPITLDNFDLMKHAISGIIEGLM